jgi:hypothetical protein
LQRHSLDDRLSGASRSSDTARTNHHNARLHTTDTDHQTNSNSTNTKHTTNTEYTTNTKHASNIKRHAGNVWHWRQSKYKLEQWRLANVVVWWLIWHDRFSGDEQRTAAERHNDVVAADRYGCRRRCCSSIRIADDCAHVVALLVALNARIN